MWDRKLFCTYHILGQIISFQITYQIFPCPQTLLNSSYQRIVVIYFSKGQWINYFYQNLSLFINLFSGFIMPGNLYIIISVLGSVGSVTMEFHLCISWHYCLFHKYSSPTRCRISRCTCEVWNVHSSTRP